MKAMSVGLLWYDSNPQRELEDTLARAAQRYLTKYGRAPDTCYVNPNSIAGQDACREATMICRLEDPPATIRVLEASNILLHHFWLGEQARPASRGG